MGSFRGGCWLVCQTKRAWKPVNWSAVMAAHGHATLTIVTSRDHGPRRFQHHDPGIQEPVLNTSAKMGCYLVALYFLQSVTYPLSGAVGVGGASSCKPLQAGAFWRFINHIP